MVTLTDALIDFVTERHLATLTLVRPDGRPHVTPVGFTWDGDAGVARVITWNGSVKAKLLERSDQPLRAAVSSVDRGRWITLEGLATVSADPDVAADAVARYAVRYSQPKDRGADRRVIELKADRVLGRG